MKEVHLLQSWSTVSQHTHSFQNPPTWTSSFIIRSHVFIHVLSEQSKKDVLKIIISLFSISSLIFYQQQHFLFCKSLHYKNGEIKAFNLLFHNV